MEVIIGKTSGFCAGVKNAVIKANEELSKENKKIYCLGELVHNKQVVEKLENKGLLTIEDISEAKAKTIIRAHGVAKEIYEEANKNQIELIDLTCPKVLKIHKIAEEYVKKGYYIVLIGGENHPESIGTISFCGKNSYLLNDKNGIENVINNIKSTNMNKVLIIAQTTYSLRKFEEIVDEFKKILGNIFEIEVINTICPATRLRQEETEKLSKEVDMMIIVGGRNSSNTKKLFDISQQNCSESVAVETVKDLCIHEIKKYKKIGIMAGASTPPESVEEIKNVILEK